MNIRIYTSHDRTQFIDNSYPDYYNIAGSNNESKRICQRLFVREKLASLIEELNNNDVAIAAIAINILSQPNYTGQFVEMAD